jgi:outer membrane protein assembly factor BamB
MELSGNYGEMEEIFGPTPQDRSADLGYVNRGAPDIMVGGYAFVRSTKGNLTGYSSGFFFSAGGNPEFEPGSDTDYLNALDPYTGALVYQIENPGGGSAAVIDVNQTLFRLSNSGGWDVHDVATGQFKYRVEPAPTGTWLPNLGIAVSSVSGDNSSYSSLRAYDHSDALRPPDGTTLRTANNDDELWRIEQDMGSRSYLCSDIDRGIMFYGSWYHRNVWAINVTNGDILWEDSSKGTSRNAIYYEGMFIHHGLQHGITVYNTTTGEIIWEWVGGARTYFGNAGAVGDGLFMAQAVDVPTGWTGCWDVYTGEMLWKVPIYINIGYFSPWYADGKLYCILADSRGVGGDAYKAYNYWAGKGANERDELSACIDVLTGEILWTMPFQLGHSRLAAAGSFDSWNFIAYGVLFFERGNVLYAIGDAEADAWPNLRGNPNGAAVKAASGPSDLSSPRWKFETGDVISSVPAVADDKVFIGSQDHVIYCLDAYTGEKLWNFTTGFKVMSSLAYDDGKVFTGADDGSIYCLNAETGAVEWMKDVGSNWLGSLEFYPERVTASFRSSPIVVSGHLYLGDLTGRFHCLNAASGNTVWSYMTKGPILGSPMYYNGVVYIASTDLNQGSRGRLYAFNCQNGNMLWVAEVPNSGRTTPVNTPVLMVEPHLGPMILMGNTASNAYGYNLTDGSRVKFWNATSGEVSDDDFSLYPGGSMFGTGSPMWWDPTPLNNLVFGYRSLNALAWDLYNETAENKVIWATWINHNAAGTPTVSASIEGTKVYHTSDSGSVNCMEAETGQVYSTFIGMGQGPNGVALYEGKLYFGHGDTNVYCFDDTLTAYLTLNAFQDKGEAMWNNETITISGRLFATPTYDIPALEEAGTGPILEYYYSGMPSSTVKVTFVKPDGSVADVETVTDSKGYWSIDYSPTATGDWSWVAYYEGMTAPQDAYRYAEAYSDYTDFAVESAPEPYTPPPPPPPELPAEYIYIAVAAVVIVLVAIGAFFLLKRRK